MERIKQAHLESIVDTLNSNRGFKPSEVKYNTIGALLLDYAYGGVKLVKVTNEQGGQTNITSGYSTKRELYGKLRSILEFNQQMGA